jgi:hypothetical protein
MESRALAEERNYTEHDFSVIENPEEPEGFRYSTVSIFELEKRLLDNVNRRFLAYFTFFALFEYFLMLILQEYFIGNRNPMKVDGGHVHLPSVDFEVSKFFFFKLAPVVAILASPRKGTTHIRLILQEFRVNSGFMYFVFADICVFLCIVGLADQFTIASILLAVKSKPVYFSIRRFLQGFALRQSQTVLLGTFMAFLFLVYFWHVSLHAMSIFVIGVAGSLFFWKEESGNISINLHEFEVLEYLSKAGLVVLFFTKALLQFDHDAFRLSWWDIPIGAVVVMLEGLRVYVIKRIQKFKRDNSARTYQPQMIQFTGVLAIVLDLVFWSRYLRLSEWIGCLILNLGLLHEERHQIRRLFSNDQEVYSTTDELLIHR